MPRTWFAMVAVLVSGAGCILPGGHGVLPDLVFRYRAVGPAGRPVEGAVAAVHVDREASGGPYSFTADSTGVDGRGQARVGGGMFGGHLIRPVPPPYERVVVSMYENRDALQEGRASRVFTWPDDFPDREESFRHEVTVDLGDVRVTR